MKAKYLYLFGGLLSAAMLVGCGGSSGGGGTPAAAAAEITEDNKTDLAVAASEATKAVIGAEKESGGTSGVPISFKSSNSAPLQQKLQNAARSAPQDMSPDLCPTSGSASFDVNNDYTNITYTFNNCRDNTDGDNTVLNGSVSMSGDFLGTGNGSLTIRYNNLRITSGGSTETVNGTVTCTNSGMSCDYSGLTVGGASLGNSDFNGDNGRSYHLQGDVSVSGNDSDGWNVNATVVDPDHGAVTISAQNISYGNCLNGMPDGGTITITADGQTARVTFNNCDSFTIEYDGSSTTIFWNTL